MRSRLAFAVLGTLLACSGPPSSPPGENPWATEPLSSARIFFSGHSLLDNPIPDYVELIAQGQGQSIHWNQQNVAGSPLRVRTWGNGGWEGYRQGKNRSGTNMNVVEELRSPQTLGAGERYDTLLITERHDILDVIRWEDSVGYLRHFHDRLIEGNAQARTYFYHTWLDVDKASPDAWIAHEKAALLAWECATSKVNLTLEAAGRADRVGTLPGGAALVDLVERIVANEIRGISGSTSQKLSLIFSDNVHLTPLGAYFMAAVHYASVYRRTPVGAPTPSGVNAETAEDLQTTAWNFVSSYGAQEDPGVRTMDECRQRIPPDVCPSFWTLKGQPQNISSCQTFFADTGASSGNPFRWPDPGFEPHPAP